MKNILLNFKGKRKCIYNFINKYAIEKNRKIRSHTMLVCVFMLFVVNSVLAQDDKTARNDQSSEEDKMKKEYKAFNASAHLKNMHTWHGFVVQPGPIFATSLEYNSKNSKFTGGLWGGASFSASDVTDASGEKVSANYKEVSIYAVYRLSDKFFIEAVSHNNFTGVEERGDVLHYWRWDKTQGYNFVDLNFGYSVTPNFSLYLATIIGGGSGDFQTQTDGTNRNSWTQYLEVKSKVWEKDDYKLSLVAGGAWSLVNDQTFYTEGRGNVINVGAALSKNVMIGNYKLPVEVMAMWNPEKEITVLQLDLTLF